jgi:hypothetical protein
MQWPLNGNDVLGYVSVRFEMPGQKLMRPNKIAYAIPIHVLSTAKAVCYGRNQLLFACTTR